MRIIGHLVAGAVALGLGTAAAQAMPIAQPAPLSGTPAVVQVADGCGPFGHRSHFGYCKPNGYGYGGPGFYGPGFYGPRPFYGRRCFIRETYFGPQRVCR